MALVDGLEPEEAVVLVALVLQAHDARQADRQPILRPDPPPEARRRVLAQPRILGFEAQRVALNGEPATLVGGYGGVRPGGHLAEEAVDRPVAVQVVRVPGVEAVLR